MHMHRKQIIQTQHNTPIQYTHSKSTYTQHQTNNDSMKTNNEIILTIWFDFRDERRTTV